MIELICFVTYVIIYGICLRTAIALDIGVRKEKNLAGAMVGHDPFWAHCACIFWPVTTLVYLGWLLGGIPQRLIKKR